MRNLTVLFTISFLSLQLPGQAGSTNYLLYVRTFADQLLENGKDQVGRRHSNLWASVIHTSTGSIPKPVIKYS